MHVAASAPAVGTAPPGPHQGEVPSTLAVTQQSRDDPEANIETLREEGAGG